MAWKYSFLLSLVGKICLNNPFWVRGSQPHTRACSEVWRGVRKYCASLAGMSLLLVLPLMSSSAHLMVTPEIKQLKAL